MYTKTREIIKTQWRLDEIVVDGKDIHSNDKEKLINNLKATMIMRFSLPPDTFRLVSSNETAKEIYDILKELYYGDADLKHSIQTGLLSKFGTFEQTADETLYQTDNRFNHLMSWMLKNKLRRSHIEENVRCTNSLRLEWKSVVSTIKAHEQFKDYSLAKIVGILKSHESDVLRVKKLFQVLVL